MFRLFLLFFYLATVAFHSASAANTYGKISDIGQLLLPAAALTATTIHEDKQGLLQFSATFVSAMGMVYVLKPAVNERRPNGGRWSFPSGHTTAAFASATYLQQHYGWKYGVPSFAAATLVGYGRVRAHAHWTRDVVAGAAIGIGTGLIFTKKYNVAITPIVDSKTVGVVVSKEIG